ncbi:hypothetical protein HNR12_003603 [Streptomonospora nanhaiensis]|uniref:Aminoglycoside phosphotransferase domain-containing protein n=1 Tax=Streptomonospora nanhaiensis TaxID=1323731 RepID=A0A853BRJ9_9ACTN|nr:hypothetical protein [Streptomonospora nanhaiensis]
MPWNPPAVREIRGQGYANTVEVVPRNAEDRHPDNYQVIRTQRVQDPYDLRVLDEVEVLRLLDHVPFVPRVFSVAYRGWGERVLTHDYLGLVFDEPPPPPEFRANLHHYVFENLDAIARTDWTSPKLRDAYEAALLHQAENIAYLCESVPGSDHIPLPVWSDSPSMEEALTANVIRCARFAERRFGEDGLRRMGLLTAGELERRREQFHTPPAPEGRPTRLVHGDLHLGNLTARSRKVVDPTDPPSYAVGIVDWELAGFMGQRSGLRHERAVVELRWRRQPGKLRGEIPPQSDIRAELLRLTAQSAYTDVLRATEKVAEGASERRLSVEAAVRSVVAFRQLFLGHGDPVETQNAVRAVAFDERASGPRFSPYPPQRLKWLVPATAPEAHAAVAADVPGGVSVLAGVSPTAAKSRDPGFKAAPRAGGGQPGRRPAAAGRRGVAPRRQPVHSPRQEMTRPGGGCRPGGREGTARWCAGRRTVPTPAAPGHGGGAGRRRRGARSWRPRARCSPRRASPTRRWPRW